MVAGCPSVNRWRSGYARLLGRRAAIRTCGFVRVRNDNIQMPPSRLRPNSTNASGVGNLWDGYLCAAIVFFIAFAVYVWTRAPTVTLVDSGELAVVAHTWGIAHPPGFPLWVIPAHFASLLPFGNVATRIALSSAFFGAVASAMVTLVAIEVLAAATSRNRT